MCRTLLKYIAASVCHEEFLSLDGRYASVNSYAFQLIIHTSFRFSISYSKYLCIYVRTT